MQKSTSPCSETKKLETKTNVPRTKTNFPSSNQISTRSSSRLMTLTLLELRPMRSTLKRRSRSMLSFSVWLKKTMSKLASSSKRKSSLRPIWSFHLTRSVLFWNVRERWILMRMRWFADMPNSSRPVKTRLRLWNWRPNRFVIRSSRNWPLRKSKELQRRCSKSN